MALIMNISDIYMYNIFIHNTHSLNSRLDIVRYHAHHF